MPTKLRATALVTLVAPAAAAAALHCGGGEHTLGASDASADGTTAGDGGPGDGATADSACAFSFCDEPPVYGPFAPCAQDAPEAGTACSVEGESCEYGSSFLIACDRVLQCVGGGWRASPGYCFPLPEGDAGGDDGGEAGCPATWAGARALVNTGSCPARDCQYPEGYCTCTSYCGGVGQIRAHFPGAWSCMDATPGCPSPRPLLGSACEADAACAYGWPCGCGDRIGCIQGVWQGDQTPVCP